jgi:hypothetical protein
LEESSRPFLFEKKRFHSTGGKKKKGGRDYLLEFDPSININEQWVSQEDLHCFNELRSEMIIVVRQPSEEKVFKKNARR